jgi:SOS-response transcriptional repressor LexA
MDIKRLRKLAGLSQAEVAKALGVTQSNYNFIENGKQSATKYASKLSVLFGCSIRDILPDEIVEKIDVAKEDEVVIDIISAKPCCGDGNDCTEEKIGKWVMPIQDFKRLTQTSPERVKQMQVSGDSMQPTINDGDFILADTSHNVFDVDGIYLIRMISGLAVKRLQAGLNAISIISDNPNYKPIEASIGEVKIIGKVIKILNVRSV